MKQNFLKNAGWIIIFGGIAFIFTLSVLSETAISDLTLNNTFLCHFLDGECVPLETNTFFGNDFENIQVCTSYSSSRPVNLEILLLHEEQGPFIGMLIDRGLGLGDNKSCYFLKEIVESWENSNMGGKYPSPVQNGVMEKGKYRIVFEQGRETLVEIHFEVLPGVEAHHDLDNGK